MWHFCLCDLMCVVLGASNPCVQVCKASVVPVLLSSRPWRRKGGGTTPRIYDLGSWWSGIMSFRPRPLYHYLRGKGLMIPIAQEDGWAPVSISLGAVKSELVAQAENQTPIIRFAHSCRPVTRDWVTPAHVTYYIYHNFWMRGRQIRQRHGHTGLLLRAVHCHFDCITDSLI